MDKQENRIPSGKWFEPEKFSARYNQAFSRDSDFCDIVKARLAEKGFILPLEELGKDDNTSNKELCNATLLSGTICSKLKRNEAYKPKLHILLAFCIGVGFSIEETKYLLQLKGLILNEKNQVHFAYLDLLRVYDAFGLDVKTCNDILLRWGIEKKHLLGSSDYIFLK